MTYDIEAPPRFLRKVAKFLGKHPFLRNDFDAIIDALRQDPFQSSLRLHPLHGELRGFHAVSLSYDYRVVLLMRVEEHRITLINIGSHDEVYGD